MKANVLLFEEAIDEDIPAVIPSGVEFGVQLKNTRGKIERVLGPILFFLL